MLYLVYGDNDFLIRQTLARARDDFSGEVERYDGADVTTSQLADLLGGATLFSDHRLIFIRGLSEQKSLWAQFADRLDELADTTDMYLVESRVDKRTKTYKTIQKKGRVIECPALRAHSTAKAEAWLRSYAKDHGVTLGSATSADMVVRAIGLGHDGKPIIDQQRLAMAIEQLQSHEGEVTQSILDTVLPAIGYQNVFELLTTALDADEAQARQMLHDLRASDDAYMVLAVLSAQIAQLSLVVVAGQAHTGSLAEDSGVHPYVLQKLSTYRDQLSLPQLREILETAALFEYQSKQVSVDPWLLVDSVVYRIIAIRKNS